jgi:molecular chaperone GrpE (heat shock protein)
MDFVLALFGRQSDFKNSKKDSKKDSERDSKKRLEAGFKNLYDYIQHIIGALKSCNEKMPKIHDRIDAMLRDHDEMKEALRKIGEA